MKHLAIAGTGALAASPALAHGGAHLHPHGIGVAFVLVLAVVLGAVFVWSKRR